MNERAIKRLLFIVAASIVVIFLFKVVLTKTIAGLNKVAADKKQAAVVKTPASQQGPAPLVDTGAAIEAPATSSVDMTTTQDTSASSLENGKR